MIATGMEDRISFLKETKRRGKDQGAKNQLAFLRQYLHILVQRWSEAFSENINRATHWDTNGHKRSMIEIDKGKKRDRQRKAQARLQRDRDNVQTMRDKTGRKSKQEEKGPRKRIAIKEYRPLPATVLVNISKAGIFKFIPPW